MHRCTLRGAWIEIYTAQVKLSRPAPTPQKGQPGRGFLYICDMNIWQSYPFLFPSSFPIVSVSSGLCAEAGKGIISLFLHYFSLTTCAYPPQLPTTRTRVAGGADLYAVTVPGGKPPALSRISVSVKKGL